jgi:hypothetical protein
MTEEVVAEWVREVWDRRPDALIKEGRVLASDTFKGHLTEESKNSNF